jgi:hypothetical protein
MERTDGRRHRPGEHLARRPLRKEPPQKRMHQPAKDEAYSQDANIEEGATGAVGHGLAAPLDSVGDTPLERVPRR